MLRWIALGCCLLLASPQDPADKVRALVEKLGSEDITEREQAQAELIKAGPSILPALRKQVASAEGERKGRIESIIAKLERAERVARFMEPGPAITMDCKDRPASEVLAELSKQAGVPVDGSSLPAGTLLSLKSDKLSLPAAIDELCLRHGGIVARWSATQVNVVPGKHRKRPTFDAGPFRFIADGFLRTMSRGETAGGWFSLQGVLIGPPGRLPNGACFEIDAATDDKGTDLGKLAPGNFWMEESEFPGDDPPRICRRVWTYFDEAADVDAARLETCKGALRLTFVLEARRTHSIQAQPSADPSFLSEEQPLVIRRRRLEGRTFIADIGVYRLEPEDAPDPPPTWLALHDAKGRRVDGNIKEDRGPKLAGGSRSSSGEARFQLPKDFAPDTLDIMEAADVEVVRIPFDFSGAPLK